ncbi:MAG: hypothetical protein U0904_08595 [Candidatus Nanopelagicales bacterium]|nr:hypothetical protein [Candidatus Nanopelagicales bacterium]
MIAKIRQAPEVAFRLDVGDLAGLQKAGVSKGIIAAMLQRATGPPLEGRPVAAPYDVWVVVHGARVEIPSVKGFVEASIGQAFKQALLFSFKNKMAIIARGAEAKTHFAEPFAVMFTRHRPSEIGIARLTVETKEDRRYVDAVSQVGGTLGEFHPPEDNIEFADERMADGSYKLAIKEPLTPGEYGLIVADDKRMGYEIYEFRIDGDPGGGQLERLVDFRTAEAIPLDIVMGLVTVHSVEVTGWPKPEALAKAEGKPGDTTALTLKVKYSNRNTRAWKCQYRMAVLDDAGREIGSGERIATLDGEEKDDTNRVSVKMLTLDFPKAAKLRIEVSARPD